MNKIITLAGVGLLAIAAAASAQGVAERGADRNVDMTRAQAVERADRMFARLDADNDGRFTPEEARRMHEQRRAGHADRMFDRLDLDRNGSITREEMSQARAQHQAARGERRAEAGQRPGMRGMRGMRRGGHGMTGARLFGEQGFVAREQFRERALARFDRLDADRNGTVTVAERREARGRMRAHMQERRAN